MSCSVCNSSGTHLKSHKIFPVRNFVVGCILVFFALSATGCSQSTPNTSTPSPPPANVTPSATAFQAIKYTYRGHKNRVTAVAWSPDGRYIASAAMDSTVHIWDANSGKAVSIYRGQTGGVTSVAWSPDGKQVVSSALDRTVQIWEATTGIVSRTYTGHESFVNTVGWSPDGKYIASGSDDRTVHVWEAESGKQVQLYKGHNDIIGTLAWSPDGKYIASGSMDSTAQVWEALTGKIVYTHKGHTKEVRALSWSPDSKYVASGSPDKTVQVWEATSGKELYTYNGYNVEQATDQTKGVLPDIVFAVAWSHDGKRIAMITREYCGDSCAVIVFWDAMTGKNVAYYADLPAFAIAWSPDDKYTVTAVDTLVQISLPR